MRTGTGHRRRGGAIMTTVILMAAVSMLVAYVLRFTVSEAKLSEQAILRIQSDNAAEAMVDYGLADLAARFSMEVSFANNEFAPEKSPLVIRDELRSAFSGTPVDLDSLALVGGEVTTLEQFYVDPLDPANRFDPLKGKWIFARYVSFYGRATAIHPALGPVTSYARLTTQLRDAPLFAHAVFYNMDLEFHPGARMTVDGPVHANGTIWLVTTNDLKFEGVMTATKDIRVGMMPKGHQLNWSGLESGQQGRNVWFRNREDEWQSLFRGDNAPLNRMEGYYTSLSEDFAPYDYEDWREYATNEFAGNLQSSAHGVPTATPSGILPYVPNEDGSSELENHAYALIEPNLPIASPYHKGEGEEEKYARKAGLIIRVHRDLDGDGIDDDRADELKIPSHAVQLRRRPDPDNGWSSAARTHFDYHDLKLDQSGHIEPPRPTEFNTGYYISLARLERSSATDPNSPLKLITSEVSATDADGNSIQRIVSEVKEAPVTLHNKFDSEQSNNGHKQDGDELRARFDEAFAAHPVIFEIDEDPEGNGAITGLVSGMLDQRIKATRGDKPGSEAWLNLIEINMAALANLLEVDQTDFFDNYEPKDRYNGILYVELPPDRTLIPRPTDRITRSVENMALLLTEGGGLIPEFGRVPNPSYNQAAGRDPGMTLATNSALYVRGHFNADGDLSTPSSGSIFESDNPDDPDPPVALAADAITLLSPNWRMRNSLTVSPSADSTEFGAAVITGLVPTNVDGSRWRSGGNHNLLRFLENWSGKTLRYRGSMVVCYESEIQREELKTSYYSPPTREWGFFREFARGIYPPGTPSFATYRKIDFNFLTKADWEAAIENLPWDVDLPDLPLD